MSLDQTKFSRITVTDDEEDDVVIHAGMRPAPTSPSSSSGVAPIDDGSDGESKTQADQQQNREKAPASAKSETPRSDASPNSPKADKSYHETTAEDLKATPMSLTQKIVIVLAALLIIAFIAYVMFMR